MFKVSVREMPLAASAQGSGSPMFEEFPSFSEKNEAFLDLQLSSPGETDQHVESINPGDARGSNKGPGMYVQLFLRLPVSRRKMKRHCENFDSRTCHFHVFLMGKSKKVGG